MKERIRYIVCPDWVTSKNDGQRHFVGPEELMRLYRVSPADCIVYRAGEPWPVLRDNDVVLRPKHSGDYSLNPWSRND